MLRVQNIKIRLPLPEHSEDLQRILVTKAARTLGIIASRIKFVEISKRSVDARQKPDIRMVYSIDIIVDNEEKYIGANVSLVQKYHYTLPKVIKTPKNRPVVVGSGPSGLFSGLVLAEAGLCPIILERGYDVGRRKQDVQQFWKTGLLNPESNVQFGEGGAGTFSDGKLTTGINDVRKNKVIAEFLDAGAPSEISFYAKPHIGTDKLVDTVKNIRNKIISLGGEIRFGHKFVDFYGESTLTGIEIESSAAKYKLETEYLILAIGHSARDTVKMLHSKHLDIQAKAFSVGVRIEHNQSFINQSQYGYQNSYSDLGAAEYKLSTRLKNGRGVYTFCMCPGGAVVAASSEPEKVVTNGMSYFARDLKNANSALLVSVSPTDFNSTHPLSGFEFQCNLERDAFLLGGSNYKAPAQLIGDFLNKKRTTDFAQVVPSYKPGVTPSNLHEILPSFIGESLLIGILALDKRLKGFAMAEAVLTGMETRSSSPITIRRDPEDLCAYSIKGIYPCGEGAGYAGGIMSAAVDGIRCAEKIIHLLTGCK